ncbi:hypothetical protein LSH36_17g11006 [Paralvinella palmiformis]|uniref:EF-hand domain-containing protein n=1 Tax=Paralvinella palmiformis TaxID=53620 RepID=A0AAD9KDC7_9ANNE|nr:hypothetical protein LSH36_17g11006 [Paralvinella palmiformis]
MGAFLLVGRVLLVGLVLVGWAISLNLVAYPPVQGGVMVGWSEHEAKWLEHPTSEMDGSVLSRRRSRVEGGTEIDSLLRCRSTPINLAIPHVEFIEGVSLFSVKGDKESKLRFAFKIYDMDKDGYISNGELFQVLKMMVGNNLKDAQLQQIVDKTIIHADTDGDGKISFEEFCAVVGNLDVHKKMVVDV